MALLGVKFEELEKTQLQNALSAMSERLLLLQSIGKDKSIAEHDLQKSEDARSDLQRVLTETASKTKQELGKMAQYQEIMLQEN